MFKGSNIVNFYNMGWQTLFQTLISRQTKELRWQFILQCSLNTDVDKNQDWILGEGGWGFTPPGDMANPTEDQNINQGVTCKPQRQNSVSQMSKCFSFWGLCALDSPLGLCPGPHLGTSEFHPQTPILANLAYPMHYHTLHLHSETNWRIAKLTSWMNCLQSGPKKVRCCIAGCNFVSYGPTVLQVKKNPLLESLLNFQKDACNICHIPSKYYHLRL